MSETSTRAPAMDRPVSRLVAVVVAIVMMLTACSLDGSTDELSEASSSTSATEPTATTAPTENSALKVTTAGDQTTPSEGSGSEATTSDATSDATASEGPAPDGRQRLWIGSELVGCEGVAPQECMLVATGPDSEPELFYDAIIGFTYEPGFNYVIDVVVENIPDPPADGSSLSYTLVEVVEKNTA